MIRACLCLLAGLYAPQLSSFNVAKDFVSVALFAGVSMLALPRLRLPGLCLLGCAMFSCAAYKVVDSRIDKGLVGDSIVATIRVTDFPRRRDDFVTFAGTPVADRRLPGRIRISWFEPPVALRPGDTWQLELRLRRPRGTSNPGVFDHEAWLFRESFGATAYVVDSHRNHLLASHPSGIAEALRMRFVARVTELIPVASQAAVLAAIVAGTRHLLTVEQWDRYARSGTSHLMAISGLHVGLAAGGGYVLMNILLGAMRYRGNQHRAAIATSLLVAALYAVFSGFAVPAQRASLMIAIAGLAMLRRRGVNPGAIIAAACLAIVVFAPLATMAPGFTLSFAAVIVLLWLARRYPGTAAVPDRPLPKICAAARQLVIMQTLLFLGLLPMTVLLFDRISFAAMPVNLLAVPVFSLVTVPFALLGLLLDGPLELAGDLALRVAAAGIGLVDSIVLTATTPGWTAPVIPAIEGRMYLALVLPLVWVVLPCGWPGRHLAWIAVFALLANVPAAPPFGCVRAIVLDVGQGLAVFAQTRRTAMLFDTGPAYRGGGSAAASVILPFLKSRGIARLDQLVVSHADLDHAGGVAALLGGLEVEAIAAGEPLSIANRHYRRCRAGAGWRHDGVNFRFLHPDNAALYEGNDASCVLLIETGQQRLLLTGDIGQRVEEQIVRSGDMQPVNAVVVAHHGSRTSSSPLFVRALRPSLAIVPAGFGNRWGFPKAEVVERWTAIGAKVLTTATSGAVSLQLCATTEPVTVREHRHDRRRIWQE